VKSPRRDKRALSLAPAGEFGGKAPLCLAAQKSRPHAQLAHMRYMSAYLLCKWGEYKLDNTKSSILGVYFKTHCHRGSFVVTTKSAGKRARSLVGRGRENVPFF
jgi:hypothetical protein